MANDVGVDLEQRLLGRTVSRDTGFVEGPFGRVCVEFRLPRERVKFELGRFG